MKNQFKFIGFDADDTLWENQPNYDKAENDYCNLLSNYLSAENISKELYKTEIQNIELYGFGAKSFMLSLIETALRISNNKISQSIIEQILEIGKELINRPIILLEGVQEVLKALYNHYSKKLVIVTKGDLLDQERKLNNSNISEYFNHVEIMSTKNETDYLKLLSRLDIRPKDFLMIGNSFKSDILPVLNIGCYGIHIPYHTTWQHEKTDDIINHNNLLEVKSISDLTNILL